MPEEELPLYLHWVKFLDWLLSRTEKFPRRMRLSLSNRPERLALDFLQDLVEARYTRDKTATLRRMNLRLEQLRPGDTLTVGGGTHSWASGSGSAGVPGGGDDARAGGRSLRPLCGRCGASRQRQLQLLSVSRRRRRWQESPEPVLPE